jgi:hypothetical protein
MSGTLGVGKVMVSCKTQGSKHRTNRNSKSRETQNHFSVEINSQVHFSRLEGATVCLKLFFFK